jgi:hypothetical protein
VTPSPKAAATPSKVSRPKGKDRKLASEVTKLKSFTPEPVPEPAQQLPTLKYQITTKQLLEQAAVVAEAKVGETQLLGTVRRVLERAIDLRKRCAAWFRETGATERYESSNEGHRHFIGVLKQAANGLGEVTGDDTQAGATGSYKPPTSDADVMR